MTVAMYIIDNTRRWQRLVPCKHFGAKQVAMEPLNSKGALVWEKEEARLTLKKTPREPGCHQ